MNSEEKMIHYNFENWISDDKMKRQDFNSCSIDSVRHLNEYLVCTLLATNGNNLKLSGQARKNTTLYDTMHANYRTDLI